MRQPLRSLALAGIGIASLALLVAAVRTNAGVVERAAPVLALDEGLFESARRSLEEGQATFRFDTFGDEVFWGDTIKLHEAIAGEANGGVGPGLSPSLALQLGLKVDSDALPVSLKNDIRRGRVDLENPDTTLALLQLNAVVGVTGFFENGRLTSVGIQCALCHSTVDDSFVPGMAGIGRRLDGWANRDLDIGQIVNFAPDLSAVNALLGTTDEQTREVLTSWGPGKFDAELFLDGQNSPTLIPPAFGLKGVNLHTWTGWGSVTHWNAFVANLEMHGVGRFWDPRLDDAEQFPIAAANGFGNLNPDLSPEDDRITPKLADLQFYQLAIAAPAPPRGSFDAAAAGRGKDLFVGKANCNSCHVAPIFTEPGWNMHTPAEIGIDDVQANRAPDRRYRTAPLAGLWTHTKGGFYHDGRFATLLDVVAHYDDHFDLGLTPEESQDLVEYLKSLPGEN
jgi:cytochrome c peroxidase